MEKSFKHSGTMCVTSRIRFIELLKRGDKNEKYRVAFRFSYYLATTIQLKIADGVRFKIAAAESIKEVSEKFADEEVHVSSTMKRQAVEILEEVWLHGKELSVWFKLFSLDHYTLL